MLGSPYLLAFVRLPMSISSNFPDKRMRSFYREKKSFCLPQYLNSPTYSLNNERDASWDTFLKVENNHLINFSKIESEYPR